MHMQCVTPYVCFVSRAGTLRHSVVSLPEIQMLYLFRDYDISLFCAQMICDFFVSGEISTSITLTTRNYLQFFVSPKKNSNCGRNFSYTMRFFLGELSTSITHTTGNYLQFVFYQKTQSNCGWNFLVYKDITGRKKNTSQNAHQQKYLFTKIGFAHKFGYSWTKT